MLFSNIRRPDLRVGDDSVWDKAEAALIEAVKATKLECINKGEEILGLKLNLF